MNGRREREDWYKTRQNTQFSGSLPVWRTICFERQTTSPPVAKRRDRPCGLARVETPVQASNCLARLFTSRSFDTGTLFMSLILPKTKLTDELSADRTELAPRRSPRTSYPRSEPIARQPLWRDRFIAALLLIPALPVIACLWMLVRLTSRGPGLYSQKRMGLEGAEFAIYKLRTMTHNCEAATGAVWAKKNDARVTWIGRILRTTHLDELPQLFNVLRGEMALVGPRPERPEIVRMLLKEIPGYADRLKMVPGVTGLAQLYAEPDQTLDDVRQKLAYDLRYLDYESMWLDLRIIGCTALKMVGLNRPSVRALLFPFMNSTTTRRIDQLHVAN